MIIKINDLKKNLEKTTFLYLLYGSNIGHIEETIDNVLTPVLTKNIFNYDESEILSNVNDFTQSILNKSFFDDEKLIIINRTTDKILSFVENITDRNITETTIILKSGVLEKKSKLRNFFEKNKNTICVPFYEDNYQSLMILAQNFLREKKIKISQLSINYIIERSKGSRISLNNELKKIANFSLQKGSVDLNDILKLTNLADNYSAAELADQCLAKNKKKTLHMLNENITSSEDDIMLVKTFLYKLKRLKKIKKDLEVKKDIDACISTFKPPIFWKDKEVIKNQLKILSLKQINLMIKKVNNIELIIKKNSQVSNQILNNFIYESLDQSNNSI
ncbi:DNA polymerase III subunit delta [Candidatus Pelagibacter sp.]|nr:DNA polymerase III subunit delta [Candidatus Pelagibacter sp.]